MLDKTEQSDRTPNPNEKPESCYCSALPKGSGLCLPLLYAVAGRQALVSTAASRRRRLRQPSLFYFSRPTIYAIGSAK